MQGKERERGAKITRRFLRLGGEEDGDAINKNRQLRRWRQAQREEYEFRFAHTFQSVPRIESSSGRYVSRVNGLPRPNHSAVSFFYGRGQDPSHFLKAAFSDKL